MTKILTASLFVLAAGLLPACVTTTLTPQSEFMSNLRAHCGKAYAGKLVSKHPAHKAMVGKAMTIQVICSEDQIRIPYYIEDNRSRNWVLSKTDTGLSLKHRHYEEDGSEKKFSQYGGSTVDAGTANRQVFPADAPSKTLFIKLNREASIHNIWAVEITPKIYAYDLSRPDRHFRVEFDLINPIPTPVTPW